MANFEKSQQRDNSGVLFVNTKKNSEKQPDYSGSVKVNGKEMQISGWKKMSSTDKPFISLAFSEPYVPKQPEPPMTQGMPTHTPMGQDDPDDSFPF